MTMKMNMKFREYLEIQREHANKPAHLSALTSPFGIDWHLTSEPYVLVGHILDALYEKVEMDDLIDSLDVATVAWELGCLDAGRYLDEAPMLIHRKVTASRSIGSLN